MGITPNENEQFASIVAGFEVTDTSAVKQMEKHAKAAEMTFIPLPNLPRMGFLLDNFLNVAFYLFAAATLFAAFTKDAPTATLFGGLALLTIAVSWFIPGYAKRERVRNAKRSK